MMLSCCLCQSIPIYYKKECNRGHNTYLEIFSVHLSQAKLEHFSCESEVALVDRNASGSVTRKCVHRFFKPEMETAQHDCDCGCV